MKTPNTVFIARGMKRSGNHAIIGWILTLEERLLFHNNAIPIRDILTGQKSLPAPLSFDAYLASSLPTLSRKVQNVSGLKMARWLAGIGCTKLASHRFLRNFGLICSIEDHDLDVEVFNTRSMDVVNILIIRSPENLFASRLRKGRVKQHPAYPRQQNTLLTRAVETWKRHAREYIGRSKVLSNSVGVYFDRWFQSDAYRREIASQLGLAYRADTHGDVASFGGGSSFDGQAFDGAASKMQVLERVALLDESERLLLNTILCDPEIQDLKAALDANERQAA